MIEIVIMIGAVIMIDLLPFADVFVFLVVVLVSSDVVK